MDPRRLVLTCLLIAGCAAPVSGIVGTGSAGAQSVTAPSLVGESLSAGGNPAPFGVIAATGEPDGTCSTEPTSTSTLNFVQAGQAVGPYPGTFTESGTFTFAGSGGPVTSFSAEFSISSPLGTITGTKTLTDAFPVGASCVVTGLTADGRPVLAIQLNGIVNYEATIETAEGIFHESGTASVRGETITLEDGSGSTRFNEVFLTSEGVEPLFPTTEAQCKNGGYALYGFENQGQCIQFVNTGR